MIISERSEGHLQEPEKDFAPRGAVFGQGKAGVILVESILGQSCSSKPVFRVPVVSPANRLAAGANEESMFSPHGSDWMGQFPELSDCIR